MAYDPEARRQSNAALIIGLVGLLVAGGATLAYFATRPGTPEPGPTTVVQGPSKTIVLQSTPAPAVVITTPPQTNTVLVPVTSAPAATAIPVTNVTRNTTVTRNTRIEVPPVATNTAAPANGQGGGTTNITVNNVLPTTAPATNNSNTDAGSGTASSNTNMGTPDASTTTSNSATGNVAAGY